LHRTRAAPRILGPAILGLAILAWAAALLGGPVYDDALVLSRAAVRDLDLGELLTTPFFRAHMNYWRPLAQLVFAAAMQGGIVTVHAVVLAMHAVSAGLVLRIAERRLGFPPTVAWIACGLFLVHPIHTESLAWCSAMPDVLAGMLSLAALHAAMDGNRRSRWGACGLLFLALLAKESAIATVPPLLVAWHSASRPAGRQLVSSGLHVLAVLGVWGALRYFVLVDALRPATSLAATPGQALASLEVFVRQFALLAVPWPLTPFRCGPMTAANDAPIALAGYGVAALTLLLVGGIVWRRCERLRAPVLLVAGAALLPALVWQSLGEFCIQDRYLYLGTAGWALLLAAVLARPFWLAVALVVGGVVFAQFQVPIWRDQGALIRHAIDQAPDLATSQVMAGDWHLGAANRGDPTALPEARAHYQRALGSTFPRNDDLRRERHASALTGLGWCMVLDPKTEFPRDAARVVATFKQAIDVNRDLAAGWVGLGATYALAGDRANAERALVHATQVDPNSPEAWFNLGTLQVELGALATARASFSKALHLDPELEGARRMLQELSGK
jgi:hypothetical protein